VKPRLLALDPGVTGALAAYDTNSGQLEIHDLPTTKRQIKGKKNLRTVLDEVEMVSLLALYAGMGYDVLFFEQIGGIPGQSAPAAFTLGHGVGVAIGAARALGLRVEPLPAATWKSALKVPSDKKAARTRASQILPTHAHMWPLVKHDGRAEAAMMAVYGEIVLRKGR
jgi:crossover junction endodeoxyribonuclease RuvC